MHSSIKITVEVFEQFCLYIYFEHTICMDDTKYHKPHHELLLKYLNELQGIKKDIVYRRFYL
ncbi:MULTISPECIES: HAD hydrolase-like protein [Bacillus cereus group]|uniref:HAD hydrolase-like protein n=1 Tax=Bacillus cereus group TaxID=86661 RepID=UPI001651F9A9|nr:HAD hydrolase-like protein [Bacillus cereus]